MPAEHDPAKHTATTTQGGFFGSRTGWSELNEKLLLEPIKGGSSWAAVFGSLLLFTFSLQVVTGILLVTCYAPSVSTAWQSVHYIQTEMPLGWLVRGMHHWGSGTMVILLLLHLIQVYVWGAYKRPRELTWMTGVLLLFTTLGLSFTGYLLPWDQRAYWSSKVGLGIASTTPVIGAYIRTFLQGGPDMGNLTLTRFFALHGFVFPGTVIALVVCHLYLFRRHGVTTAWWKEESQLLNDVEPFWPGQVWKDLVAAFVLLLILAIWTCFHPAPLDEIANPAVQPPAPRPEWYFMFLFQVLKFFPGQYEVIGTVVLPSLFFGTLFFWPLIDRNPSRDPRKRKVALTIFGCAVMALVGLTIYSLAIDVHATDAPGPLPPAPPELTTSGHGPKIDPAPLFAANCLDCHGADGTGSDLRADSPTIPDFTKAAWQKSQTDDDLFRRIYDGKMDAANKELMPAFKDKLTVNQISALAGRVRAFSTSSAPK
jgi:ubiquinol-cytochrome c reductase cytochrome b subunit